MHKIFISYSHKDEEWKDRLVSQLGVLQEQGLLEIWDDRQISGGEDWEAAIAEALNSCHVAVLLITANFLTSKFILGTEVPTLLQRQGVRVMPLIVKPCAWQKVAWLGRIQARPKDGRPLSGGSEFQIDTDLANFAQELASLLRSGRHAPSAMPFAPLPPEKIQTAKLPTTTSTLFGREAELKLLDQAWADPHTHLLSLVAWGGVGKTALVNEWLSRLERDNYRGAERVFGWSFYSQGTREERNVSADSFFDEALRWFEYSGPPILSPWDKGIRLAELIRQQKTLLILDGVEPLQYPPGQLQGELKDQGLKALLKELARANLGLCVVTTRVALQDISHTEGKTSRRIDLENLSPVAGSQLLRHLQVKGTDKELAAASREFGGHALALNLLGRYLAVVHEGEVRKRDLIPHLTEEEKQGGHARRVMESYERWLAGKPECDILHLMGLFDRPAAKGAIDVLLAKPAIKGLTTNLQNLSVAQLQFAFQHLRDLRLLAEKDAHSPDTLDCHPLVREHFGEKLRQQNPAAWKEAHRRLYEYYKNVPAKELPDTLEEMEPLFAAVAHGCQAGRHQEALLEVYWKRICRGEEAFVNKTLGAFGADLSALSNFFEVLWRQPASGLTDDDKAVVLSWAGFALRALGRLAEASQPMQAAIDNFVGQKNWKEAAINAGNLSELYLTLGEVSQAVASARQSVDFADRSRDGFIKESMRTTLADALHQAGELTEAQKLFREAEAMQKQRQPEFPFLYSLRGFQFCDLLLSQGQYQEVQKRARQTLEWAKKYLGLLDVALDKLSLGRAFLLLALSEVEGQALVETTARALGAPGQYFDQAREYLQQAVAGLREAGRQDHLPRALFARAACYRSQNEFALASADLEEAREIAERGGMKLWLADYHLEAGRLQGANGKGQEAREHLNIAARMIEEMGYGRRKPEVEELEKQLNSLNH
ncbi:MAG: hypothetical protein DKINENOH_02398 [bacterium]|nr:hypothetical protein [bacterium]